jgi:hypothetical protein
MGFKEWWNALTGWLKRSMAAAAANGLTDQLVRDAYWLAKEAAGKALENEAARAFVVAELRRRGIPESIARTALELAVQLLKRERVA